MKLKQFALTLMAVSAFGVAHAKVAPDQAARLGKDLTPMGAEKAANKGGTIPAWAGGLTGAFANAGDKPLYTITNANMATYAAGLSEGMQAMLKRYPTYKVNVYPSRRTGNAPDFVYAATAKNAVNATLGNNGESLDNAVTGIPFPIPAQAQEVVWNHKTRYRGLSGTRFNTQAAVAANSNSFSLYKLKEDVRFQYSFPNQEPAALQNVGIYFMQFTTEPVRVAGQILLVHETLDQVKEARRAWLYNPGQKRIRRAPNVGYDNPATGSDGLRTNDQLDVFNGGTDRYTWKMVGKKDMIVPYNATKLSTAKYASMIQAGHINPDLARYEWHRVWIVEGDLKAGTSHVYKKRRFYVDEDTWTIVLADNFDARGALYRVQEYHSQMIPSEKAISPVVSLNYDLVSGRYLAFEMSSEEGPFVKKDIPIDYFTTANVQKLGK